jgi:hypothetical protein
MFPIKRSHHYLDIINVCNSGLVLIPLPIVYFHEHLIHLLSHFKIYMVPGASAIWCANRLEPRNEKKNELKG